MASWHRILGQILTVALVAVIPASSIQASMPVIGPACVSGGHRILSDLQKPKRLMYHQTPDAEEFLAALYNAYYTADAGKLREMLELFRATNQFHVGSDAFYLYFYIFLAADLVEDYASLRDVEDFFKKNPEQLWFLSRLRLFDGTIYEAESFLAYMGARIAIHNMDKQTYLDHVRTILNRANIDQDVFRRLNPDALSQDSFSADFISPMAKRQILLGILDAKQMEAGIGLSPSDPAISFQSASDVITTDCGARLKAIAQAGVRTFKRETGEPKTKPLAKIDGAISEAPVLAAFLHGWQKLANGHQ